MVEWVLAAVELFG